MTEKMNLRKAIETDAPTTPFTVKELQTILATKYGGLWTDTAVRVYVTALTVGSESNKKNYPSLAKYAFLKKGEDGKYTRQTVETAPMRDELGRYKKEK